MLEKVLTMFELRDSFDALASAEKLPLQQAAPAGLSGLRREAGLDLSTALRWKIPLTAWWHQSRADALHCRPC
jgi:hypothetical protein